MLKDAGHDVGRIADLLGVSESQVYRYLSEFPRQPSGPERTVLDGITAQMNAAELDESAGWQVEIALALADKMDKVRASDKAQTGSEMAQLSKELRAIVADILGTSQNDKEWLAGLLSPVRNSENA